MRATTLLGGSARTVVAAGVVASLGLTRDVFLADRYGAGAATDAWALLVGLALAVGFTLGSAMSLVSAAGLASQSDRSLRSGLASVPRALWAMALLAPLLYWTMAMVAPDLLLRRESRPEELELLARISWIAGAIIPLLFLAQVTGLMARFRGAYGRATLYAGCRALGALTVLLSIGVAELSIAWVVVGLVAGLALEVFLLSRLVVKSPRERPVEAAEAKPETVVVPAIGWSIAVTLLPTLSFLTDKVIASAGQAGEVAILEFAYKLVALPHGLLAMSLVQVAHVELSRRLADNNLGEARRDGHRALWLLGPGMALVGILLALVATPLVELVYGRGAMDLGALDSIAAVLVAYSPSLVGMGLGALAARLCFIRGGERRAGLGAIGLLILNALADLWIYPRHGVEGIAAVTSVISFLWAAWLFLTPGLRFLSHRREMA